MRRIVTLIVMVILLTIVSNSEAASLPVPPMAILHHTGCNSAFPTGNVTLDNAMEQTGGACTVNADVYIPISWPKYNYRFTKWHEFGHVFDNNYLTNVTHISIARILHRKHWSNYEQEFFADIYGNVALGHSFRKFESNYGNFPTRKQYRKVTRIIRSIEQ